MITRPIWCCGCDGKVQARLTDGREICPDRPQNADTLYWRCDTCLRFVGCRIEGEDKTSPKGVIMTKAVREASDALIAQLRAVMAATGCTKSAVQKHVSRRLGWRFGARSIRTVEHAELANALMLELLPAEQEVAA